MARGNLGYKRSARVSVRLHSELSMLLMRSLRDPRVAGATVTRVEMPDDLQIAKIYVRCSNPDNAELLLAGLRGAAGKLRYELGKSLKLKRSPELRFYFDNQPEAHARIDELLGEIAEEQAAGLNPQAPEVTDPADR